MKALFFMSVSILFCGVLVASDKYRRVCYYYSPLSVEKLDVSLCTHIIYNKVIYENKTLVFSDNTNDEVAIHWLKKARAQSGFKLLVCHSYSGVDPEIGSSQANMAIYAKQAAIFLRKYDLDGLDLDWEYPENKTVFSNILITLRSEFDKSNPRLMLTMAAAAIETIIMKSYDIPVLAKTVDILSVMSYGYREWSTNYFLTGHHAPLYPSSLDYFYLATLNLDWTARYYTTHGMPADRVVLGIPTYAVGWTLLLEQWNGLYVPVVGPAVPVEMMSPQTCQFLKLNGTEMQWDDMSKVPFASNRKRWYSFESFNSAAIKVQYIKTNGFGGAMIFSLNADMDLNRSCGTSSDFPMHAYIKHLLEV